MMAVAPEYRVAIRPAGEPVDWSGIAPLAIEQFHPASSTHRPITVARLVHHGDALRVRWDVQDRYVVAQCTANQQYVCQDSCVELFLRPSAAGPYFNFEFNCCGRI